MEEINKILNDLGLDEDEIKSVEKRNKLLNQTIPEDVNDIVNFFSLKCSLGKDDIAKLIIKNPLILNESFERIDALYEIYKNLGFSRAEYKKYATNFDKAFSLNPKEVLDNVSNMLKDGYKVEEIKEYLIEKSNKLFE